VDIPRPGFCAGEVVNLVDADGVEYNAGYEVLETRFLSDGEYFPGFGCVNGSTMAYRVLNDPIPGDKWPWWAEKCLRKRPQNNWENSVWTPAEIKEKCLA